MIVWCQFCGEVFDNFETYRDHIKSKHIEDVNLNIKLEQLTFAKEYECKTCEFKWIYKKNQDKLCIFEVEGQRYCTDCKNDAICKSRLEKLYKNYFDGIETLDDIVYPELWVPIEKTRFTCCCCSKQENPIYSKKHNVFSFYSWPEHLFCVDCFHSLKSAVKTSDWDPFTYCECGFGYYLKTK